MWRADAGERAVTRTPTAGDTWTPERIEALQAGIDEGLTFVQIAERAGLTKNQCIGKASRLGLRPRDDAPLSRAQLVQRARPDIARQTTAERLDALNRQFPGFGCCVFPIGAPGDAGFRFCSAAVPADNMIAPYCAAHQAVTWQAAKPRPQLDSPEFVERRRA